MTEENATPTAPSISINGQYIKDLSFEAPNAPAIFSELGRSAPEIPIQIDIRATQLQDNTYEAVLNIHVEGKVADKTAFIVELAYAGVFTVSVPQEHLQPVLLIECPRLLFPFARNIIAEVTRDGGFPPLMMQPVDFVALYRQRMERVAAVQQQGGPTLGTA